MSLKSWISVFTLALVALVVFFSRHEIGKAIALLDNIDLWVFALIIPVQLLSYLAAGEMMFSYLRAKGSTEKVSPLAQAGMALEMNFVNHTLPSAGVSGLSYMTWRLSLLGITPGRAAAAQLVRFAAAFMAFIVMLLVAVIAITLDGDINRWIILLSTVLAFLMGGGILLMIFILGSKTRIDSVATTTTRIVNKIVKTATFGRKKRLLHDKIVHRFFGEMHDEYITLKRDRRILIKPFVWGVVFTIFEVLLFMVAFWALGISINPAVVLIAYGLASIAGFIVVTPGGAGAYEAIMVWFLALSGVAAGTAIAGILLTRVSVLLGTIIFGYVFYQRTILKHGKSRR